MRITLVHNPRAGYGTFSKDALLDLLTRAGYDPEYHAIGNGVKEALVGPADLVVAAGGDGTVCDVAREMRGRNTPLAVLPLGTANNIARCLGWEGSSEEIAGRWAEARTRGVDVGRAQGPAGVNYFFESAGVGLLAEMMPDLAAHKRRRTLPFETPARELKYDIDGLREALSRLRAQYWAVRVDGEDVSGAYLMVEAMNIGSIGPCLHLAPEADPGDGLFDVVLVPEEARDALEAFLISDDGATQRGSFEVRRARSVELCWKGAAVHTDDVIWSESMDASLADQSPTLRFSLQHGGVTFLSP